MSAKGRLIVFLVGAAALVPWLGRGLLGLPPFGAARAAYGELINAVAESERHVTNAVTAVNFDYRGVDTLGEEYILFAAVAAVAVLLREERGAYRGEPRRHPSKPPGPSEAVRWSGLLAIGLTDLFGLYVVVHAAATPGGGFQGGAILGTGSLLAYLATDDRTFRRVSPKRLNDLAEAVGAGGYALIGLATLAAGGAFLENILPLARSGDLAAGGTIPLINLAVGLEVAAGFALLFREFLEQVPGEEGE
ncbi:MAG TPA: MnhB domain-containing protein [Isosphaeraceae bacterium]|jgi:multicomponent Na+:H+ antiporter subunit B|nr:MnhB domain-containing protein [Isosphaeraceae bacterium]